MSFKERWDKFTSRNVKPINKNPKVVLTGDFRALGIARLGDIVFIQCEKNIEMKTLDTMREQLETALLPAGVRAVVLPFGMTVARITKDTNEATKAVR